MQKIIATITIATLFAIGLTASANAQAQQSELNCTEKQVSPSDAGYKRIGIRTPKANVNGQRVTQMALQINMPIADARTDTALDNPKINKVFDCGGKTAMLAKVVQEADFDATEVVVPETLAKGTKLQVCSKSIGCVVGTFEAFDKWVTLSPATATATAKITGNYK